MTTRKTQLEAMLAARTRGDGKPAAGFKKNVAAIKREISRLSTTTNLVGAGGG